MDKIVFDESYPKGSEHNPALVIVGQESKTNNTLSVTLTKNVVYLASKGKKNKQIERGDRLIQYADSEGRIILRKYIEE